jgi:antitoxin ParD1/3/4
MGRLVKSGRYQNATKVLRLIELREAWKAAKLEALREAAQVGFADLRAGRFLDFASFDELEDHLTRATEDALKAKPL